MTAMSACHSSRSVRKRFDIFSPVNKVLQMGTTTVAPWSGAFTFASADVVSLRISMQGMRVVLEVSWLV